jgi:hypothetical protein
MPDVADKPSLERRIRLGMTGDDLAEWRHRQPGEYTARNGQKVFGWSQEQAAKWYGCGVRQWQRYESGESPVNLRLVRRLQAHRSSFEDVVDRMLDTPDHDVEDWGGINEDLKHEKEGGIMDYGVFDGWKPADRRFIDDAPTEGVIVMRRESFGRYDRFEKPVVEGVRHIWSVHSPDGFEWGYGGSGPADLALNILGMFVPPPEAWRLHHDLKFDVLAHIQPEGGHVSLAFIREWIEGRWVKDNYAPQPAA